jgi:hypothetical protein
MKLLINAFLRIADALERIAVSLETNYTFNSKYSKRIQENPKTSTSTTFTSAAIPKASPSVQYFDQTSYYSITKQEKEALDRIYNAIKDSGPNPKYHQKIMADIAKRWPSLSSALVALVAAKSPSKKFSEQKPNSEIWNYKDARKHNH